MIDRNNTIKFATDVQKHIKRATLKGNLTLLNNYEINVLGVMKNISKK